MKESELRKLLFERCESKEYAEKRYKEFIKFRRWNKNHSMTISFEEIDKLLSLKVSHPKKYPSLFIEELTNLYKFNKFFSDKHKSDSKIRWMKISCIIDEFISNNPVIIHDNLTQDYLNDYIKSDILSSFVRIFNSDYILTDIDKMDIRKIRYEVKQNQKTLNTELSRIKKSLGISIQLIKNLTYYNDYPGFDRTLKHQFFNKSVLILEEYQQKISDCLQELDEILNIDISELRLASGESSTSRWSTSTYLSMFVLGWELKTGCKTSIIKVGKLFGHLLINFGIYPEKELQEKKSKLLCERFPDIQNVTSLTESEIYRKSIKQGLKKNDVKEILNDIESEIAYQFAENYKKIEKRMLKYFRKTQSSKSCINSL